MNEPLVSVITPVYGRLEWLPLTLESLRNQTYKNFEVQIVNDAGEDPAKVLEKYPDLNIKYSEHKKNSGLPVARNTGMENSTGDYFVFLDSDDQLMPLSLEFRLSMMKKYEAEIVYTRVLRDIYERRKITPAQEGYALVAQQLYWNCEFNKDKLLVMNISPCNGVMFSRKSWDDVGNYKLDSGLRSGEDFDFWQELSRKNDFKELLLLDCSCSYRTDGGQMTGTRNFAMDLPRIFSKRRNTATNKDWVVQSQNQILRNAGIKPEDFGL
jgi:glycosyltransferase involved in cell wall biosynthesis